MIEVLYISIYLLFVLMINIYIYKHKHICIDCTYIRPSGLVVFSYIENCRPFILSREMVLGAIDMVAIWTNKRLGKSILWTMVVDLEKNWKLNLKSPQSQFAWSYGRTNSHSSRWAWIYINFKHRVYYQNEGIWRLNRYEWYISLKHHLYLF